MDAIKLKDFIGEANAKLPTNSLKYLDYFILTIMDFTCGSCDSINLVIIPNLSPQFPGEFVCMCSKCFETKSYGSLPLSSQSLIADRISALTDIGIGQMSKQFGLLFGFTVQNAPGRADHGFSSGNQPVFEVTDSGDSTLPKGYRPVGWIREYEAAAIVHCYKSQTNFERKDFSGRVIFQGKFYSRESEEFKKFKANVFAIRVNWLQSDVSGWTSFNRIFGWISSDEAKAILKSCDEKKDIEFQNSESGMTGRVQYFDKDSKVAQKYNSNTRLLRKE